VPAAAVARRNGVAFGHLAARRRDLTPRQVTMGTAPSGGPTWPP